MANGTGPAVPADHSLTNIGIDFQRTLIGVGIIAIAVLAALGYVTPDKAGAAIALIVGAHYVTT
jgi:hypothetical protein